MKDHVTLGGSRREKDPRVVERDPPTPPEPPLQDKLWRFYHHQLVGIPVMVLIVVAALFGLFGLTDQHLVAGGDDVTVEIDAVERFRYRMIGPLVVTVTNTSGAVLEDVTVRIDRDYLARFSEVAFSPSVTSIDETWWTFQLGDLSPGEVKVVSGEVRSESFGSMTGTIEIAAGDEPVAAATVRTLSYP